MTPHTPTHTPTHTGGTVDYGPFPVATPTTLPALLLANDTRALFGIPVTNDNLVEGDESFFVSLSIANELSRENGGIVFLGNLTMATVVITDNDGKIYVKKLILINCAVFFCSDKCVASS